MDFNGLDLPSDWQVKPLREAYNFTKKPRGLVLNGDGQVPFLPMDPIPIGRIFVTEFEARSASSIGSGTYVENGDLLVAKITPSFENGKQAIVDWHQSYGFATTEVIPIQEKPGVSDKYFLFHLLLHPAIRANLAGKMDGTTGRQRLSKEVLGSFPIPLPPLAEQRKIAAVLGLVQRAIEQQERLIALTTELKKALLHKLFTEGLRGEPQKQTEIGPVPESWEVNRLGEHCTSSAFGPRFSSTLYTADGNVVTLRTTDLDDDGNIDYRDAPKARLEMEKFESHLLLRDDVVVSRSGTCGIAAVFEGHMIPVLPGAFLVRLRLAARLRPQFLRYYIIESRISNGYIAH